MKNKWKSVLLLLGASCLAALVCTFCIYKIFPQYLCYAVYGVSESELYESESRRIAPGASYTEYFTPLNAYLKSIAFNLESGMGENSGELNYIKGTLLDEEGKAVAKNRILAEASDTSVYCEFPIEKWVEPGRQYRFVMEFPDSGELYVTFGPDDIGPAEHGRLLQGTESADFGMYLRYVYGSYSKKLLALWFLIFFVSAYLLGECFLNYGKQKRISGKSM